MDEKKIEQIEAQLLEQEHRPLSLIRNFIGREQWEKQDPRRKAVKTAILWRIVFSPGVIAMTGGLIAVISLVVLVYQTSILMDQNDLIKNQNYEISNQTYLIEAQRRSTLQFEISEILNRIDDEIKTDTTGHRSLSDALVSRIIAATVSMKPYRSYENDTLQFPYSYEKGQFFVALTNSNINNKNLTRIFNQGNFSDMILTDVEIGSQEHEVVLEDLKFENSFFENVKFINFKVERLVFNNSVFLSSELRGNYGNLSFYDSQIDYSTIQYENAYYNGISDLNLGNSQFTNCAFQGNGNDNISISIYLSEDKNLFKYTLVDSILLEFQFSSKPNILQVNDIVLTDNFESNFNISKVKNDINLKNVYSPTCLSTQYESILFESGLVEGLKIKEAFNDYSGLSSYLINDGMMYHVFNTR